jgi:superfamily II DNA or RNA helicase
MSAVSSAERDDGIAPLHRERGAIMSAAPTPLPESPPGMLKKEAAPRKGAASSAERKEIAIIEADWQVPNASRSIYASKIVLLDYQEDAAAFLAGTKRGLLQSPAGSGKTIIAAAAVARVVSNKQRTRKVPIGWIANTVEQCDQARAAFARFPELEDAIEVTICCPAGAPAEWELDLLIVDEAHHAPAATWQAIVSDHPGCLWLLSATPFGEDEERNAMLRKMVGNQIHVVPRSAVAARVLPAKVFMLSDTDENLRDRIDTEIERVVSTQLRYSDLSREEIWRRCAAHTCIALGIVPNRARNQAIVRTVAQHASESVLVIVATIKHGEALKASIPGSVLVFSKLGARKRREAIAGFRDGTIKCLIATSLADEGFDAPIASVLILAGAGRSANRVEQRCGRVLRAHGGKTCASIYDFVDFQHPLLRRQSEKRRKVYVQLGYSVSNAASAVSQKEAH